MLKDILVELCLIYAKRSKKAVKRRMKTNEINDITELLKTEKPKSIESQLELRPNIAKKFASKPLKKEEDKNIITYIGDKFSGAYKKALTTVKGETVSGYEILLSKAKGAYFKLRQRLNNINGVKCGSEGPKTYSLFFIEALGDLFKECKRQQQDWMLIFPRGINPLRKLYLELL